MRDPNVTSLYFATPLAFNDLRKISGRGRAKVENGEEILSKVSTP